MQSQLSNSTLAGSVIAVPPLARHTDLSISVEENKRIINYLEEGGVSTLLYGGNANLYHIRLNEYGALLQLLSDAAHEETTVIPSIGPSFGMMMSQIEILRQFEFPTAMVLPTRDAITSDGIATGIRHAAEAYGKPLVLYIKHENGLTPASCKDLVDDGLVSAIKYAIVRDDPKEDAYLRALLEGVDPAIIVSGMGEQPAIVHMRDFGLTSFTSGCVCVAPALAQKMLRLIQAENYEAAEGIRQAFEPLEGLRNGIHPVRVLHESLRLGGIANTGTLMPLFSNLDEANHQIVQETTRALLNLAHDA